MDDGDEDEDGKPIGNRMPKSWRFGDYLSLSLSLIMEEWQQDFWGTSLAARHWLVQCRYLSSSSNTGQYEYSGCEYSPVPVPVQQFNVSAWAVVVGGSMGPRSSEHNTNPCALEHDKLWPGFDKSSLHVFVCVLLCS